MEFGKGREWRRDRAKEGIIREVEGCEVGELREEWGEWAWVACGVEGDLVDVGGVRGAGEAAGEVGSAREWARVNGEVPRC